jgi:hypothetical protein
MSFQKEKDIDADLFDRNDWSFVEHPISKTPAASTITKTIIKEQQSYGFYRLGITNTSSMHPVAVLPIIYLQLSLCFGLGCTCAFLEQNLYSVQIR